MVTIILMSSLFLSDCQLMSLSKDKTLRIWSLSQQLQQDLETDLKIDISYIHIEPPIDISVSVQTPPTVEAGIEAETSFGRTPKLVTNSSSSLSTNPIVLSSSPNPTPSIHQSSPDTPSLSNNNSSFFSPSPSDTLVHEFNLLTDIPNLTMEQVCLL